jgi:hypothetical protein
MLKGNWLVPESTDEEGLLYWPTVVCVYENQIQMLFYEPLDEATWEA